MARVQNATGVSVNKPIYEKKNTSSVNEEENSRVFRVHHYHHHHFSNDKETQVDNIEPTITRIKKLTEDINKKTEVHVTTTIQKWESEINKTPRTRFENPNSNEENLSVDDNGNIYEELFAMGERTEGNNYVMNLLLAISFCTIAIYTSKAPTREIPLPELVKVYRQEELKLSEHIYQEHRHLKPAFELVWNEARNSMIQLQQTTGRAQIQSKAWLDREVSDHLLSFYTNYIDGYITMAKHFTSDEYPIHAVIAYFTAARIRTLKPDGNEAVAQITLRVHEVFTVIKVITKEKPVNLPLVSDVIQLMRKMVSIIRSTKSASKDDRVEQEAWCLTYIGRSYESTGQFENVAKENEKAVKKMEEHFGEKAQNFIVYGICLNSASVAYWRMGDHRKTKKFFEAALRAFSSANDTSEEGKILTC